MSVVIPILRDLELALKKIARITSSPNMQFIELAQAITRISTDGLEENNQDYH
jgi:hypothetical protein